ncbi:MAG: EamA family transporter [Nitrospiraceae bacterium]|nr:MAG: EamA family transporter [Nitrospiraceae bacterium]
MGHFKIIAAILIWSSLGIFIRKIDLPNHCIIFYVSLTAGTLQFLLLSLTGLFTKARRFDSRPRNALFLVLSPLCFMTNALLFYFAFRNTTIANAVLTHYTAPVFVAILAPVLLKEQISRTAWLAILISSVGLWLILSGTGEDTLQVEGKRELMGIAAGALSGLAYAFLILIIRRIAHLYSSLFITFIQNGIVAMVLLPFVFQIPLQRHQIPYLLTMGVVHSTIAPLLYVQGFRSVKANEAAILGYFEPVGAAVLALIFFHEVPGAVSLIGGALILFSGYLILRSRVR